jgi:hypothetical protein
MGFIRHTPAANLAVITATDYVALSYALLIISALVLVHSYFIHGRKYCSIRISTDVAASAGLLSGISLLVYIRYPTPANTAAVYNFFYNGLFTVLIQLSDNYMFYTRLLAVTKVPRWKRIAINAFIWLVLTFTWLPYYTILPFFYDCNSTEAISVYSITLQIEAWSIVVYNFYFTLEFSNVLYMTFFASRNRENRQRKNSSRNLNSGISWIMNGNSNGSSNNNNHNRNQHPERVHPGPPDPCRDDDNYSRNSSETLSTSSWHPKAVATRTKTKIIAIKSIGHCITSSLAALIYTYVSGIGFPIYDILYILGMHLWFNWSLEKYCKQKTTAVAHMSVMDPPAGAGQDVSSHSLLRSDMLLYDSTADTGMQKLGTMTNGLGTMTNGDIALGGLSGSGSRIAGSVSFQKRIPPSSFLLDLKPRSAAILLEGPSSAERDEAAQSLYSPSASPRRSPRSNP